MMNDFFILYSIAEWVAGRDWVVVALGLPHGSLFVASCAADLADGAAYDRTHQAQEGLMSLLADLREGGSHPDPEQGVVARLLTVRQLFEQDTRTHLADELDHLPHGARQSRERQHGLSRSRNKSHETPPATANQIMVAL